MAAPTRLASIAESLGVAPDQLEADIKVRPPEDQGKSEREHERGMFELRMTRLLSLGGLLLCAYLSWLFLHYGKPDQAEKVIAALLGFVGGVGIGRRTAEK